MPFVDFHNVKSGVDKMIQTPLMRDTHLQIIIDICTKVSLHIWCCLPLSYYKVTMLSTHGQSIALPLFIYQLSIAYSHSLLNVTFVGMLYFAS